MATESGGEPPEADWLNEPEPDGPPPRKRRSDTLARILWVLPWIVFAIAIVAVGDLLFAAAMVLFACAGMNEYFLMAKRARPFAPVAYVAAAAIIIVAHYEDQYEILMLLLAALPALFVAALFREKRNNVAYSIAVTIFALVWIDAALRLRGPPARPAAPRRRAPDRRPRRHLRRRHRGVRRRPLVRPPPARAGDLPEQDDRGPRLRRHRRHARLLVRRPLPGLAARPRRACDGRRDRHPRPDRRPLRVADQARPRRQGLRQPLRPPRRRPRPPRRRAVHVVAGYYLWVAFIY